ncbi:hypothetical protein, partial [Bacillus toyonensis]|uniref:hypothetical protein n=1 Tax=Bacillus toyonensis TaxID=155322 RepID=UPI0015D4DC4F
GVQPQDVWSEAGKIAKDVLPTVLPALISLLAAGPNQQLGTLSGQGVQPQDIWSDTAKTVLPVLFSILAAGPNQLQLEGVWNNTLKPSGAAVPVLTSLLSNN